VVESDIEFRCLDPIPEVRFRRLLQLGGVASLERAERHKVILVAMRGQALHESLLGDVIVTPATLAAEAFDGQAGQRVDYIVL